MPTAISDEAKTLQPGCTQVCAIPGRRGFPGVLRRRAGRLCLPYFESRAILDPTTMSATDIQILTTEQAEAKGWNAMVAEHPLGSAYHHTAFSKVISATFGHTEPYFIALANDRDHLCGGMLVLRVKSWLTGNRLVSVPWACYADPMVRSAGEFKLLFEALVDLRRQTNASYIEIKIRDTSSLLADTNLMSSVSGTKSHALDLTDGVDVLWNRLDGTSVKQHIRKAERSGVRTDVGGSEQDMVLFYRLFVSHRRRLGLPPQKPEYFQNIWRYMAPHGLVRFWMARLQEEIVGGLLCFAFRDKILLGYIGVDESLHRCGVGQYLFWTAIRAAAEEGMKTADLGKTPSGSAGLLRYKRGWGGVETDAPTLYYPHIMGVSSHEDSGRLSYRAMRLFWRVAPPLLSKVASGFFYRHTG